jgi:uncharacterized protein
VSQSTPDSLPASAEHALGDTIDQQFLQRLASATDQVILALSPRGTMEGKVREIAQALIPLASAEGVRIGVVGGAGSLLVNPEGPRLVYTEDFPEAFKAEALEMVDVWDQPRRGLVLHRTRNWVRST